MLEAQVGIVKILYDDTHLDPPFLLTKLQNTKIQLNDINIHQQHRQQPIKRLHIRSYPKSD